MACIDSCDIQTLSELAIQGDYELVRLRAKAELMRDVDAKGQTVLMLVANSTSSPTPTGKCIEYFLHLGLDPSATEASTGDTPAHLAVRRGNLRLLTLLPFNAKWLPNWRGANPLMESARTGSSACAKHLLHQLRQKRWNLLSNDRRLQLLQFKDFNGQTALDLAVSNGHRDLANEIERELRIVLLGLGSIGGLTDSETKTLETLTRLIDAGDSAGIEAVLNSESASSLDLPAWWGQTALLRACGSCACTDAALWQRLVQLGDASCATVDGFSCLHRAASVGNLAAIDALLRSGATLPNARDSSEQTPLMSAARWAPPSVAAAVGRSLLAAGANWQLTDKRNMTALDIAQKGRRNELADLLFGLKDKSFFDQPMELPPGCSPFLNCWDSLKLLGRGGYGEVHEVLTDRGVRCAAKSIKLPVQLGDQPDCVREDLNRSIESERNLCQLKHDNIVRFLYIAQLKSLTIVLFMELLDGCSLERFLSKQPLEEAKIQQFSRQICCALRYLHSREPPVLHRDINCSNIIVTDTKTIKLIDFGLSIKLEQYVSHVSSLNATPRGTVQFMAPELLAPKESESVRYSRASDIWAFGCTLYQMATGKRPYAECTNMWSLPLLLDQKGAPKLPESCSTNLKDFYRCCTVRDRKARKSAAYLFEHSFLLNCVGTLN